MKSLLALTAAGLLALSAPAFAQSAGSPGATGATNGLTGSDTGTGPATMNNDSNKMGGGAAGTMNEGRATAPDQMTNTPQDPANNTPKTVRGDQNGQDMAK